VPFEAFDQPAGFGGREGFISLQNIAGERSSTIVFPLPVDFLSRLRGA
jgi:hypothetical protein